MSASGELRIAGGRVVGAFASSSIGGSGWSIAARRDFGGLTPDAIDEGRRFVERLPWWAPGGIPLAEGHDPWSRPRRLAWVGGDNTPRRFLLHTIHAQDDASGRPGNNYTECLVVNRPPQPPDGSVDTLRPSQLWDLVHWRTPWGAAEAAAVQPGDGPFEATGRPDEILTRILDAPMGHAWLLQLFRSVHGALHGEHQPIIGRVEDVVWGAVLLDTVLSLLPAEDLWAATFDLRSIAPDVGLGRRVIEHSVALVNLYGSQAPSLAPGGLDLTERADPSTAGRAGRWPGASHAGPCPRCGTWFASVDALLSDPGPIDSDRLFGTVQTLQEARRAHARLGSPSPGSQHAIPSAAEWSPSGYLPRNAHPPEPSAPALLAQHRDPDPSGVVDDLVELHAYVGELLEKLRGADQQHRAELARTFWVELGDAASAHAPVRPPGAGQDAAGRGASLGADGPDGARATGARPAPARRWWRRET